MELEVDRGLVVGTSEPLRGPGSTRTAPDQASLRRANPSREMMDGTSRTAFLGNCRHIFLVQYLLYLFVIGTLAYIEHMVVPSRWCEGIQGVLALPLYYGFSLDMRPGDDVAIFRENGIASRMANAGWLHLGPLHVHGQWMSFTASPSSPPGT